LLYAFEVLPDSRLRGIARGAGTVTVTVERDGAAAVRLGTVQASESGAPIDLSLDRFSPSVARLGITVTGEVTLHEPAVVTPGAPSLRDAPTVDNVLIYLTDTLRADHLRVYDRDSRVETPGLDLF